MPVREDALQRSLRGALLPQWGHPWSPPFFCCGVASAGPARWGRNHPPPDPSAQEQCNLRLLQGDALIILGGRYTLSQYDADIITRPSGTAGAWITISGQAGNRPILAGRNNLATAVDLPGAQYMRRQNLEITHDNTASGEAAWFRERWTTISGATA